MNTIKIYGLKRTGTAYLTWLFQYNLKDTIIFVDYPVKKNYSPQIINDIKTKNKKNYTLSSDLMEPTIINYPFYILCIKSPYSWYLSMCRFHRISAFPVREGYIKLWNKRNREYQEFFRDNVFVSRIVKYEEMLNNPSGVCDIFSSFRQPYFMNCLDNVRNGKKFNRDYYVNEEYISRFSKKDLRVFDGELDKDLMDILEYKVAK